MCAATSKKAKKVELIIKFRTFLQIDVLQNEGVYVNEAGVEQNLSPSLV